MTKAEQFKQHVAEVLEQYEWFDGEDEIAQSRHQRDVAQFGGTATQIPHSASRVVGTDVVYNFDDGSQAKARGVTVVVTNCKRV